MCIIVAPKYCAERWKPEFDVLVVSDEVWSRIEDLPRSKQQEAMLRAVMTGEPGCYRIKGEKSLWR